MRLLGETCDGRLSCGEEPLQVKLPLLPLTSHPKLFISSEKGQNTLQRPRAFTPPNFTVFPRGRTFLWKFTLTCGSPVRPRQAGSALRGSARRRWLRVGPPRAYDKARGRERGDKVASEQTVSGSPFTRLLPCSRHLSLVPSHL